MFLISRDTSLLCKMVNVTALCVGAIPSLESRFCSAGALACHPRAMPEADMKRAFGAIHCCSGGAPAAGEQPSTMGTSSLQSGIRIRSGGVRQLQD